MSSATPLVDPPSGAWQRLAAAAERADALTVEVRALLADTRAALAAVPNDDALASERISTAQATLTSAARLRHAAAALQVITVELAERSEVRAHDAERSAHNWMARHAGLSPNEAGAAVRAATAGRRHPAVAEALADGTITPAHAEAIAGIVPDHFRGERKQDALRKVADATEVILREARRQPVRPFREFCARVRDLLDQDGAPDRSGDPSRVTVRRGFDGRWILHGDLAADFGAIVATLLEAQIERTRRSRTDGTNGTNGTKGTDGTDAPDRAAAADTDAPSTAAENDEPERRPRSEELAEALGQLLTAGAAVGRPGNVGVHVHIDLDDLVGARDQIDALVESSGKAHTELGLDLSDDALWGLMCGSRITPVLNLGGTPLAYGRTRRLAPDVLAHVLRHRDRTCCFPNCEVPGLRLRMHHLVSWEDGGTTDPENVGGACNGHHHDVHDRGWRVEIDADGQVRVFRPDGTRFDPAPRYLRSPAPRPPDDTGTAQPGTPGS